MKKIVVIIIALILSIFYLGYEYFSKLNTENNAKDFSLQTATINAAVVFSFQNDKSFVDIMSGQTLLQHVLGLDKMLLLNSLKTKINTDKILQDILQDQTMYVSLLPDSANSLGFLFTFQLDQEKNQNKFLKYLNIKTKSDDKTIDNVLQVNDSLSVFYVLKDNVVIASNSINLIKQATNKRKANGFANYVKNASNLNRNVLASLYINFNKAPSFLKNILAGKLNGELFQLNNQNSYATLNYNFSKEHILFNGYTDFEDGDSYQKLFSNLPPQTISITNILPENVANFTAYAVDSYPTWLKNLNKLKDKLDKKQESDKMLKNVEDIYHTDLTKVFNTLAGNQFIKFQLSTTEKLAAFSLNNGDKFSQLTLEASQEYDNEIRIFKTSGIISGFFGEPFDNFSRPYFTIVNNYLVVSNNASTLQSFLNSYKANKFLAKTPEYLDTSNLLTNTSNISFYVNLDNSKNIFSKNFRLPYYRHLRADSGFRNFDTFYYQMSADKDRFLTNLLLNKYVKPKVPDSLQIR